MKFIIGIFLSSLFLVQLSAQDYQQIDSLYTQLEYAEEGAQTWNLLNALGWAYRLSHPDSTLYYGDSVLNSSASSRQKATAFNFRGIAFMYKGEYAEAFESHRQALDLSLEVKDSLQIAHSYNNLGRLFFTQGDRIKAYDYITNALSIFEQIQDIQGIGYCYKSLVQLYMLQKDSVKVEMLLNKTLSIRQQLHDIHGQISTYQELADFHEKNQDYDAAHHYLQQAMSLSDSLHDQISIAETNLAHANLWFRQSDYKKSKKYLSKALAAAGASNNKKILSSIYLSLAKNYYARELYDKARIYLLEVIDTTVAEGNLRNQKEAYHYLSRIYEARQQYQSALLFHQRYIAAKDSLYNTDMALSIERLENRLEMEEKDKEYELLKAVEAQNREIIKQSQIKDIAKNIIIVLVLLLLITLFAFYLGVRQKNRLLEAQKDHIESQNHKIVEQNLEIKRQNEVLCKQNKQLEEIDKEKDTLLDIVTHDLKAPFHRISGLADILAMSLTKDESESQRYIEMIKYTSQDGSSLVNDLLNSTIIENRHTMSIEEVTLHPFLEKLVESFENQAAAKSIGLHIQADETLSFQADALYLSRILENLISNAIKYSSSHTQVYLMVQPAGDSHIKISVKDEGPGFSDEDKKFLYQKFRTLSARPTNGESSHGLGLAIVKILVERLHAKIELVSEPGQGSEFILTFSRTLKTLVNTGKSLLSSPPKK
ncbi:MAG: tetratricopeptide repeat-containing sensor histidine kinase [Cyclobacteriaceae bacterium]